MALTCLTEKYGISTTCDTRIDITATKIFFLSLPGTTFTDATDFATEATWKTKIAAGLIFPIKGIVEVEGQDGENVYQETSYQDKILLLEGRRGAKHMVQMPLDQYKIARGYNGKTWEVFTSDILGNLIGVENADGTIQGRSLSYFHVNSLPTATADTALLPAFEYIEGNVDEFNRRGAYLNPSDVWSPSSLDGPLKVVTSSSTVSTNVFTTAVSYVNDSKYQSDGDTNTDVITGLVIGNFEVINQAGVVITPTSITETAVLGTYTVTCAAITSGSIQVVATSSAMYQSEVEAVAAA